MNTTTATTPLSPEDSLLDSLGGATIIAPSAAATAQTATSTSGRTGLTTSIEERALVLLGSGVQAEAAANALGVTPSRIAQLLSEKQFSGKVAELRYENLQRHNKIDSAYDTLEEKLLKKLDDKLFLLMKPESIIRALHVVNQAKRKGQAAPTEVTSQQTVVTLVLPKIIPEKFSININNQVTRAGEQELLTMASGDLLKRVEAAQEARVIEYNELNTSGESTYAQEEGS